VRIAIGFAPMRDGLLASHSDSESDHVGSIPTRAAVIIAQRIGRWIVAPDMVGSIPPDHTKASKFPPGYKLAWMIEVVQNFYRPKSPRRAVPAGCPQHRPTGPNADVLPPRSHARLVQLAEASDSRSECSGFESRGGYVVLTAGTVGGRWQSAFYKEQDTERGNRPWFAGLASTGLRT
jgi:hypothetical protein